MPVEGRDYQAEADAHLDDALKDLEPAEAALFLAVLGNRVGTRLHNLARSSSGSTKGTDVWASWAALQNAARNLVLQASTCRDLAGRVAGRRR